ncbi:putative membrane protein [Rhodococcus sp. MTM3W5.2]|nr:putative membrane protein [Rhodococcus sp. MTM3W5.2]
MTDAGQVRERWSAAVGVYIGFLVGVFLYLPITMTAMRVLDVPSPNLMPPRAIWNGLHKGSPSYYASWAAGVLVFLAPGIVCLAFDRSRRFGVGYAITVTVVSALAALAVISLDLGGPIGPD